jgi:hypothetical protein
METRKEVTTKDVLSILERMRYEAQYNSLQHRVEALDFAIHAIKRNAEIETICMDDGK